ncbi:MAG: flagellar biosynthesis protein FlhA, partial [Phycisphaerales bacterium]
VIFLILVIVQFVVITKGATRISEVAARFTLDAMPGKQMAIDADLNAGIINEQEARRRRERIGQEADFFGAMDGASKFVRGDAIASIIITIINVLGGMAVGIIDRGWEPAQTASVFTKLTIGDGLTSQIPSFGIAIASALIVTRSGSKDELGKEFTGQLLSQPTGLAITAGFLVVLSMTPLPTIPLLATALLLGVTAFALTAGNRAARKQAKLDAASPKATKIEPPAPESLLKLDTIELEVGFGLVALVDAGQGGDLLERISAIRRQLTVELGVIMPPVRIRDNLQLPPTEYRLKIKGNTVARGISMPGKWLAIDPGIASGPIAGEPAKEPAFGLDARWIEPSQKSQAEALNYTVVDATSVVATHLTEMVRTHASDLLSRQEVSELVAQLKARAPKLVEEVVPTVVKTGDLHRVLQNLLRERVPIRDMETIVETLADWSAKTKDLDVLTEYVRNALRRTICQQYAAPTDPAQQVAGGGPALAPGRPRLVCITLDPALEDQINSYIDRSAAGTSVNMPASVAQAVTGQIMQGIAKLNAASHQPVVIASPPVRAVVRQLLEPVSPAAAVLGYNEVASGVDVESIALIPPVASGPQAAVGAAA